MEQNSGSLRKCDQGHWWGELRRGQSSEPIVKKERENTDTGIFSNSRRVNNSSLVTK